MIPKLIGISKYKNLMVVPNKRSSHKNLTPNLGGIAFFACIVFGLFFLQSYDSMIISFNLMVALTILFMVGIKDDLMVLGPKAKILAQLTAITFLILNSDIHIESWHGFLGVTHIPLWVSIFFSYFGILGVINAYNLIDGVDGLAASLGIVIFAVFGLVFYNLDLHFYFLLAFICVGFLMAFLRFNLSTKSKIFMGDTGSMIIGFLIGVFTLRFLALSADQFNAINIKPDNAFLLIIAILFIPLLDVLRVVIIRLLQNKRPFTADQNHVHHLFIKLGWSHIKTSVFLTAYSCVIIAFTFVLNNYFSANNLLVSMVVIGLFTMLLLFHWNPSLSAIKQKLLIKKYLTRALYFRKVSAKESA